MDPFFTVIVPTRNRLNLLSRSLRAIEEQTFRGYEVLIIADNPTPEELCQIEAILQKLSFNKRLLPLPSPNGWYNGPYVTRNVGIKESRGPYCAFCDDDDLWLDKDHLRRAYEILSRHSKVEYYFGNQVAFMKDELKIKDWLPHITCKVDRFKMVTGDAYFVRVEQIIDSTNFPHLNSTVVAKRLAEKIGGFWEDISYSGDLDFFLRAVDKSRQIVFRNAIVSRHDIPDRSKHKNVSAVMPWLEKQITYITISNHIRITCSHPAILRASMRNAGYALKRAAEHMNKMGSFQAAWFFARQALATAPTIKWLAFTLWLGLKNYLKTIGILKN